MSLQVSPFRCDVEAMLRLAIVTLLAACTGGASQSLGAEPWPLADDLFRQDHHWLGGDLAATVDLGDDRTLWLFGDSFIATSDARTRREAVVVHSSIAVMTGRDPTTATMDFTWQRGAEPKPWLADEGMHWLTPSSGIRLPGGALIIFVVERAPTPVGPMVVGSRAIRVADPSGPPGGWKLETIDLPLPSFAPASHVGTCVALDGEALVAISVSYGDARIVRWSLAALAAGQLGDRTWWDGHDWTPEVALVEAPPVAFRAAGPSCSLSYGATPTSYEGDSWLYMQSSYGDLGVVFRETAKLEGPYSDQGNLLWIDGWDYPPYPRVLSGLEHPSLVPESYRGLATYVASSANPSDLLDPVLERELYWPHVVRLMPFETGVE